MKRTAWSARTMGRVGILASWALAAAWCAAASAQQTRPAGPYDSLDPNRLADALNQYKMVELLAASVGAATRQAAGGDFKAVKLLVAAKLKQARENLEKRDTFLDEAVAVLDKVIRSTQGAANDKDLIEHYRFRLQRLIIVGVLKTDPHVERLSYFLSGPDDAKTVKTLTDVAVKHLDALVTEMENTRDEWTGDDERLVTGVIWGLEEVLDGARYHGARICLYRAMALPGDDASRGGLLRRGYSDVAKFADADDNESGVKFDALIVQGMCFREMGKYAEARRLLKRAGDARAGKLIRLKALFETARSWIDEGKHAEADKAIAAFTADAGALMGAKGMIAVEVQSTLLRSRLLEVRSRAAKAKDPKASEALFNESVKILLDFVATHPKYQGAFMDAIAPKFEGRDPRGLKPGIQLALGVRQFTKGTAESRAKAEELLGLVLAAKGVDDDIHAIALWYLGYIKNFQKDNTAAARFFHQLATSHPKHARAPAAALNAVKSLQGVLIDRKMEPPQLGTEFVNLYAQTLATLVTHMDVKDPKSWPYHYELGVQQETLKQFGEAILSFQKVPSASGLYEPSRYKMLTLRVAKLLDSTAEKADRVREANRLIPELKAYFDRAVAYKHANAARVKQVRAWGADCGLRMAELLADIRNAPDAAIARAEQVRTTFKDVRGIQDRCLEFIVTVALRMRDPSKAAKYLDKLQGREDLIARAVGQIRERIERIQYDRDAAAKAEVDRLRKLLKPRAVELYAFATKQGFAADKMYTFKQILAGAYEFGSPDEVKRALGLYEALHKDRKTDPINVRGLARCHRRLGDVREAKKYYDLMCDALPARSNEWWRIQLERLQFHRDIDRGGVKTMRMILLQIRRLSDRDTNLGGYWKQFKELEAEADKVARGSSAP